MSLTPPTRHRPLALTLVLLFAAPLAASLAAPPVHAQEASPGRHSYAIPAGTLEDVLTRFTAAANIPLSFDPALVGGLGSPGLNGSYSKAEGLRQILQGSGLVAEPQGNGSYTLRKRPAPAPAAESQKTLSAVIVSGARTKDEIGHDNVYEKDISNLYVDRKYLERYKGVSTGDVFAGANGVYNVDNRNGSALSPIIRGFSGNGRIPVTVDGTVQSLDVWQAVHGISNRSYVDPNLFRSIEVEKGPSMTRGIKSGVGGSVAIRTIDASDIIEPGKTWGFEIKAGTANNSNKPSFDAHSLEGKDYRDITGAASTQTMFGTPGVGFYVPQTRPREKGGSSFNGDAWNIFLAGGYQHERFDVMAAYSDQRRGNYYAGKKGASSYKNNIQSLSEQINVQRSKNMYPNIGEVFPAGYEVPYTSSSAESYLFKANWKIDQGEKLSLGYTRNNLQFGELPVAVVDYFMTASDSNKVGIDGASRRLEYPFPDTTVKQDIWRLGYELKPAGSRWLDMDVNLWRTDSKTSRYQTGDVTYGVSERDLAWDQYVQCSYDPMLLAYIPMGFYPIFCPDMMPGDPPPASREPNTNGRYDLRIGSRIDSHAVRTGFDISNRFRLSDRLSLTTAADYQYEEIRDNKPVTDIAVTVNGSLAQAYGPSSGRRNEYGVSTNLEWQATDRLSLSAGVRYGGYWGYDDESAYQRSIGREEWKISRVATDQRVKVERLLTDEEMAMYGERTQSPEKFRAWESYLVANNMDDQSSPYRDRDNGAAYWIQNYDIPLHDGKADASQNPFYNGTIDINETADAQGLQGIRRYKAGTNAWLHNYKSHVPADQWKRPETQRAHAWSTQLVASYLLTDRSRVYARYASMARFPSILETANRVGRAGTTFETGIKPERNDAWEVGYHYDLSGLLSAVQRADVKLAYYHSTIHDYYDRNVELTTLQFDRKISSGIELQGRFDTGRFYGNLGVTYRFQQKMCDKDYSVQLDSIYNRVPECMDGGLIGTLSYSTLQPKYSVNLDFGMRLLERKLDLGMRVRHHSKAENESMDRMLNKHQAGGYLANGYAYPIIGVAGHNRPYFWDPVTLLDMYAEYQIARDTTLRLSVDNLTNRYYMDPLTRLTAPAPGRTARVDLSFRF